MQVTKIYIKNGKLSFTGDTLATFQEYETAQSNVNPHSMLDVLNCLDPYEMVEVNYNGVPTVFEIDEDLNLINHNPTIEQLEQEENTMTTTNDQHYLILQGSIFSIPSLEGVLWQWQDNPFAGLGASAMEQVPILSIPPCGELALTPQSTMSVLSMAQGAAMMGVSTDAGKAVVEFAAMKDDADHQNSVQIAIQEWISLAEKALSDLGIVVKSSLSFCEFMDLANESGEFDFDPKAVCKKAVKEYGWSVIEAECGDWGDYFDFEDKKIVVF